MTDHELRVVLAKSREDAEAHLKRHSDLGPRYVSYYGEVGSIIDLT